MGNNSNYLYHRIIVLYTINEDDIRDAVRKVIEEKLEGERINESTYSVRGKELWQVKDILTRETNSFEFHKGEFLSVLYSAALVNDDTNGKRDKMKEDIIRGSR